MEDKFKKMFNWSIRMISINVLTFTFFLPIFKRKTLSFITRPILLFNGRIAYFYKMILSYFFIEKAYFFYRWLIFFLTSKGALFKNLSTSLSNSSQSLGKIQLVFEESLARIGVHLLLKHTPHYYNKRTLRYVTLCLLFQLEEGSHSSQN